MIPRTLEIKNFLSYGTDCPPISFEGYSLICLSGNNGHGKSALLDAITWAIWGCARKIQNSARADQGLLRLGQDQMMVIFDCIIDNCTYRIKREFELVYGKPKTTLDFGIVASDGTVQALSEKTIRDTQAKINNTIGLDYETFVNSSFLRQGNANEFSKRSPKERKEIISTILGLNLYDALKRAALEKAKIAAQECAATHTLITHTHNEITELDTLLSTHQQFQESMQQITRTIAEYEATRATMQKEYATQETEKQHCLVELHTLELQKKRYADALLELKTLTHQWRTTRAHIADAGRYTALQKELQEARTQQTTMRTQAAQYHTTKEQLQQKIQQYTEVTHARTTLITQIKNEHARIGERLSYTYKQVEDQLLQMFQEEKTITEKVHIGERTLQDTIRMISELAAQHTNAELLQKKFDKRKETYQRWTAIGNMLRSEQHAELKRLQLTQDIQNPSCPLCEQTLSGSRKRFLEAKITVTAHRHTHQLERLKRIVPQLKTILVADHALLQNITEQKATIQKLEHTRAQEEKNLQQLHGTITEIATKKLVFDAQKTELTRQRTELMQLQIQEPSTPELVALQHKEKALEQAIIEGKTVLASLSYDPNADIALDRQIASLNKELELYEKHAQSLMLQQDRAGTIALLVASLKKEKKALKQLPLTQKKIASYNNDVAELTQKISIIAAQEHHARMQHQALLIEQGKYDAAQTRRSAAEKTITTLEATLYASEAIVHDYQAIAMAVGKDGIQALLIEEAIPEIEEYANGLLAKLTNNTAHIMIESLRDLKSGGTKETLDIKISDAQGVRPYEMFSGGEAFRIDIALRIAISKLLAHRAGTALQTLIIDEGFGSQDEDGLSAMIDVLHTLQSEFAKIIVVSHLPMMKDQFPVHFVVEKGARGSMVRVIEQG